MKTGATVAKDFGHRCRASFNVAKRSGKNVYPAEPRNQSMPDILARRDLTGHELDTTVKEKIHINTYIFLYIHISRRKDREVQR